MTEPKMPTPEEMAKINKERILSDANLVGGGAEVTSENKIMSTVDQQEKIKLEFSLLFAMKI